MAFQRCFLQLTKQYMSRSIYQPNVRPTCCQMYHNYSTDAPRKFSDRHEWVIVDNNIGTVGISKYAQESLGDVVFAQLPEPDTVVEEGDECGALESVKAASEIYSPVSGTITEKNVEVESKPALINTNYYDKGWLFRVKLTNPEELKQLMTEEQYETFLKTDVDKDDKEKEKQKETDT
ncbi:glycine cleavage system H protein, mitochondrial [Helicoverpa armigera]|uniref:glycine cleavage system H protein, mitochondrial n=1 Tax=Helicoverpa armigera TaxID=29058 RepID=UPI000B393802|nr:glycine cleavage system H protein, mitochondrial [Helicoverpa armigera]PZC80589.1 hypothetical protein B5X24_HaOG214407 [Helicoverpa armigera]